LILIQDNESKIGKVIIKTAPKIPLENERDVLRRFKDHPSLRPSLNEISEPPCVVLKCLNENVLNSSNTTRLEKTNIKFVAKKALETLNPLHEAGYVHTGTFMIGYLRSTSELFTNSWIADVKPDNILVNYSTIQGRFSELSLVIVATSIIFRLKTARR
jgi:hypothetical protein